MSYRLNVLLSVQCLIVFGSNVRVSRLTSLVSCPMHVNAGGSVSTQEWTRVNAEVTVSIV